ncbi:hypothetical protein H0H92_009724 [Tricholoma furcatifolium]|nr:hypothetical protein H0H92_009724 [Tricholoma furcatifolium]
MCLRSRTRRPRKQSVYPSDGSSVPEAHQLSGLAGALPPSHVGQQQLPHVVSHRTSSVAEAPYQQLEPDRSSTVGKLQEQLPPVAEGLPSQVDETLAGFPRFRILIVGKSGIGKSSLVKNIFNIDPDKIDIAHDRAGKADIDHEYKSPVNPRFFLHDSQGFEHGSDGNLNKVEKFLQLRQQDALPERIHAIWLCIETPLSTGSRVLQTGDDVLLRLANKLNIPIIAVFTKYDALVNQFFKAETATSTEEKLLNADKKASESFSRSVKQLDSQTESLVELSIPSVKVSVKYNKDLHILNLTNVTRERLQDVEEGLKVVWVAAQQVNARQKVDVSISLVEEYWLDLGQSSVFKGQTLIDCIHRLHDDVLKVWNFHDPKGILSGVNFFTEMIGLVKPLIENQVDDPSFEKKIVDFGETEAQVLVPLLRDFKVRESTIKYLYDNYQRYPSTAKLLATYLINLILILHGVLSDILPSEPPRELSEDVVFKVVESYKTACEEEALDLDSYPKFSTYPEQVIEQVIKERLG